MQQGNIHIRGMDLRPLDRQSPDGLCRLIENLRPQGLPDRAYWSVVRNPLPVYFGVDTVDFNWYYDSRGKAHVLALTKDSVVLLDPDDGYGEKARYDLPESAGRRFSTAQIGELLLVSLVGSDGMAEKTLLLYNDSFIELQYPPEPSHDDFVFRGYRLTPNHWEKDDVHFPENDKDGLVGGVYNYRLAYRLKSGDYLPAGTPGRIDLVPFTQSSGLPHLFRLNIENYKPNLSGVWADLIDGVAVFLTLNTNRYSGNPPGVAQINSPTLYRYYETLSDGNKIQRASHIVLHDFPYYLVASFDFSDRAVGDRRVKSWGEIEGESLDGLLTQRVLEEGSAVSSHRIYGSYVYSYNNRALLGNSSVDFAEPILTGIEHGSTTASPVELRVAVRIESNNVSYWRWSDSLNLTRQVFMPGFKRYWSYVYDLDSKNHVPRDFPNVDEMPSGFLTYPDRRASHIRFFKREPGGQWKELDAITNANYQKGRGFEMHRASRLNIAYWLCDHIDLTKELDVDLQTDIPTSDRQVQTEPNRIFVSEPDNPLLFSARSVQYIGTAEDRVTGFGVNTLPISQGQFGQYPLYVFSDRSIYALEQDRDPIVSFGRISPVSIRDGVVDPDAIVNAGRLILFVSNKGVGLIGSDGLQYISEPINKMLLERLGGGVCLGYHKDTDIEEVWVGTSDKTFIYSLIHHKWSVVDRGNTAFRGRLEAGSLYALSANGEPVLEDASSEQVDARIQTHELNFGAVDYEKKIHELMLRMSVGESSFSITGDGVPLNDGDTGIGRFRIRYGAFFGYQIDWAVKMNPGDWVESIDVNFETRRTHTRRR